MNAHNIRSPKQWDILSQHAEFPGRWVVDLGCGHGDILRFADEAGAIVVGVDQDATLKGLAVQTMDIGEYIKRPLIFPIDIAICFSVLPYLNDYGDVIQWMASAAKISFIECQYAGDGPGFDFLKGNDDMQRLLSQYFPVADPIGYTLVEGRNTRRYIWKCTKGDL